MDVDSFVCIEIPHAAAILEERILTIETCSRLTGDDSVLRVTIAPTTSERISLGFHPMFGPVSEYRSLLERTGLFLKSKLARDEIVREAIIAYKVYLSPVVITAPEHYLWRTSREGLQAAASAAGFPIDGDLAAIVREKNWTEPIDRASVVKAILDASSIVNHIPSMESAKFLVGLRNPKGRNDWYNAVVTTGTMPS